MSKVLKKEWDKTKPVRLAYSDVVKLEREIAGLVKEGWTVEKKWKKWDCYFAVLVWKKD